MYLQMCNTFYPFRIYFLWQSQSEGKLRSAPSSELSLLPLPYLSEAKSLSTTGSVEASHRPLVLHIYILQLRLTHTLKLMAFQISIFQFCVLINDLFAIINSLLHMCVRALARIISQMFCIYFHSHSVAVFNGTLSNFLPCLNN